jgi:CBS domain-containing protein
VTADDARVDRAVMLLERHCLKDSSARAAGPDCREPTAPAPGGPVRAGEEERGPGRRCIERGGVGVYTHTQVVESPIASQPREAGAGYASPARVIVELVVRHVGEGGPRKRARLKLEWPRAPREKIEPRPRYQGLETKLRRDFEATLHDGATLDN